MHNNISGEKGQTKISKTPWYKAICIKNMIKSMLLLFLFSLLYGIASIFCTSHMSRAFGFLCYLPQTVLVSLFGAGLYIVCVQAWGKYIDSFSREKLLHAWIASLAVALAGFFMICVVEMMQIDGLYWVSIPGWLIGMALVLLAIPSLILFFFSVYWGSDSWDAQIREVCRIWKKAPLKILAGWLLLLVLMIILTSLIGSRFLSFPETSVEYADPYTYTTPYISPPEAFVVLIYLSEPGVLLIILDIAALILKLFSFGLIDISSGSFNLFLLQTILQIFFTCSIITWTGRLCEKYADLPDLPDRFVTVQKKRGRQAAGKKDWTQIIQEKDRMRIWKG